MYSYARSSQSPPAQRRLASIAVLSAAVLVTVFAFVAFTADVGFITLTTSQLQNAADAAAMGAALELQAALGPGAQLTSAEAEALARQAAVDVAAAHRGGELDSIYADGQRDVRFGKYVWDASSSSWVKTWGTPPYNLVEVTLRRDQGGGGDDQPLPLFFAPVIGHDTANLSTTAQAAVFPGAGFAIPPGSDIKTPMLPIALDQQTWDEIVNGIGGDKFMYDDTTGALIAGQDGIKEANLYPEGGADLPPGNRGTVDLGASNNSTSDLKRQILDGLNESDLSASGGKLGVESGPLQINGDTGLSAAIKDELSQIIGETRAIPIFSQVSGPGENAEYTIVKFVGVRVLDVQLTGSPSNKHLTIQPAPLSDVTVVRGKTTTVESGVPMTPPALIE